MLLPRTTAGWSVAAAVLTAAVFGRPAPSGADANDLARDNALGWGRGPGIWNHPTGVTPPPEMTLPDDWPLGPNGTIVCSTCHEQLPAINGSTGPSLRDIRRDSEPDVAFCTHCHDANTARTARSVHWLAVRVAHVRPDDGGAAWPGIDAQSRKCLGCHDGVTAGDSVNGTDRAGARSGYGHDQKNHPIGIPYRTTGRNQSDTQLRPVSMLPAEIRLPQGRVSCVSCHNLYAKTPKLLSAPIEESHLCFTCHSMN